MNGLISFHIVKADLPTEEKTYVRLEMSGKNVSKSRPVHESKTPTYNYHTSVLVDEKSKLTIQVQKKRLLGHSLIGEAEIPVLEEKEGMQDIWVVLKPEGKILIRYSYLARHQLFDSPADCMKHLIIGMECDNDTVLRVSSDLSMIYHGKQKKPDRMMTYEIREARLGLVDGSSDWVDDGKTFTIVYGHHFKTWIMKAKSTEDRDIILKAIAQLISNDLRRMYNDASLRLWKRHEWLKADKNHDNVLSVKEVTRLMCAINLTTNKKKVHEMFSANDDNKDDNIDFEEFSEMCNKMLLADPVKEVFDKYCSEGSEMTVSQFAEFLKIEQKEEVDEHAAREILHRIVSTFAISNSEMRLTPETLAAAIASKDTFSDIEFQSYLESTYASAYNPASTTFVEDSMNETLAHYFINSSHNTYLMEDQLKGPSSVEAYIRALQAGCRCVEMDCWDGDKGEPVIFHGHTLTSKILFKDAITQIKNHAFTASSYPVLLSIENHCSHDQQVIMAKHLKDILGDALYYTPHPEDELTLPSPASFKNKFLIKGKKLKPAATDGSEPVNDTDTDSDSEEESDSKKKDKAVVKPKLAEELSELVTHMQGVHFVDFATSEKTGKCYNMSSFGESKLKKLAQESTIDWIKYNCRQLSRTYPGGARVDSSNYDPTMAWKAGCQIVALNFQTPDGPMQVNTAFFKQNGGCGYVLKPEFMRCKDPVHEEGMVTLKIKVINGNRIPKPTGDSAKGEVVDSLCKVYIHDGGKNDPASHKTPVVKSNGFNPRWDEDMEFTVAKADWYTSVVRFVIRDEDLGSDDFIGYWACPLDKLRQGYRMLPLCADNGFSLLHSYLFVHIEIM
eukprot:CFRG6732T1